MKIEIIIKEAAAVFGLTPEDILSFNRTSEVHAARVAVVYIADKYCFNRRQIGEVINRDHSSVTQAVAKAKKLLAHEPFWAEKVLKVEDRLIDIEDEPPVFIRSQTPVEKADLSGLENVVLEILKSGQKLFAGEIYAKMNTDIKAPSVRGKLQKLYHAGKLGRTMVKGKYTYHLPVEPAPPREGVRLHSFEGVNVTLPVEPWLVNDAVSV